MLDEGAFGEALLNHQKDLVIKFSHDVDSFRNAIFGAMSLQLLNGTEFRCLLVLIALWHKISIGFTHNDFKENNICVNMTSAEPVATIIDFELAHVSRCSK